MHLIDKRYDAKHEKLNIKGGAQRYPQIYDGTHFGSLTMR
jgi:hypothetical protein